MNLERFKSHRSGRLVEIWYEDRLCLAFVPHPLPPDVALNDPELQLTLSEADRALGELAGLGRNMPNPQLLISPFIRREAVLSSRIEGTQTDIEELYVFKSGQSSLSGIDSEAARADRLEVANYVRALEYGIEKQKSEPVNLDLVRELHGILMKGVRGDKAQPGEFRTIQNWIGRGGRGIRAARYVPPPVKELSRVLEEFEGYLQAPHDLPPLIRLALIHYQFEAIHPFIDGNGRSGRLLISLLLVHWGLLAAPILYLSAYFEKYREDYYDLLLAVTERGEWREWVGFFLEGVLQQAKDASKRAMKLQDLQTKWRAMLGGPYDATSQVLADSLFVAPYVTVRHAQQVLGLKSYMGAQKNVEKLVALGILRSAPISKPEKLFVASEIMEILATEK